MTKILTSIPVRTEFAEAQTTQIVKQRCGKVPTKIEKTLHAVRHISSLEDESDEIDFNDTLNESAKKLDCIMVKIHGKLRCKHFIAPIDM